MRTFNFHFHHLPKEDGAPTFEALLESASKIPPGEGRTQKRESQGDALHLLEIGKVGKLWVGDMIRIRMEDLPEIASFGGKVRQIDLDVGEGIGERTAWLFDPDCRVLVTQGTRVGTSPTVFLYYVAKLGGSESSVTVEPVLSEDGLDRLANMSMVRSLTIKSSNLQRLLSDRAPPDGVEEFLSLQRDMLAPVLEVKLTMSRQRGGLSPKAAALAKRVVGFFHSSSGSADAVHVEGYNPDGDRDELDLLKVKMTMLVEVEKPVGRRVPWETRKRAIESAWRGRVASLRKQFGGGPSTR